MMHPPTKHYTHHPTTQSHTPKTTLFQLPPPPPGLIGLFAPPEELSAGAVIGCFEFYALAHQADFDVCWCKGSVAERIFEPLMKNIQAKGGEIVGNRAVQDVKVSPSGAVTGVVCKDFSTGKQYEYDADAVVFSVGITGRWGGRGGCVHGCVCDCGRGCVCDCCVLDIWLGWMISLSHTDTHTHMSYTYTNTGMQKIVSNSPTLGSRPEFNSIMNLEATDVIATRMWFDKKVNTRFSANVLAGFEENCGGTFFNLNELQVCLFGVVSFSLSVCVCVCVCVCVQCVVVLYLCTCAL